MVPFAAVLAFHPLLCAVLRLAAHTEQALVRAGLEDVCAAVTNTEQVELFAAWRPVASVKSHSVLATCRRECVDQAFNPAVRPAVGTTQLHFNESADKSLGRRSWHE